MYSSRFGAILTLCLVLSSFINLTSNQQSPHDEFCTELTTSKQLNDQLQTETELVCQNLGSNYRNEIFHLLVFSNNPAHCVSWVNSTALYYERCLYFPSNVLRTIWSKQTVSSRHSVSSNDEKCTLEFPLQRYVDVLFLIEHSGNVDKTKTNHLKAAIQSLAEHIHRHTFDISARISFILYSLKKENRFIFVEDFTPVCSIEKVLETLETKLEETTELEAESSEGHHHSKLIQYASVESSLEMVSKVLQSRNENKILASGMQLSFEPRADLHVVTVSNLHSKFPATQRNSSDVSKTRDRIEELKLSIERELSYIVDSVDTLFSSPTSLHFFFSKSNTAAKTYLGDPSQSVRYDDCTHFNKALTLKALIAAGNNQGSSLQAHLLSKGVDMQVAVLGDLAKRDCILGISPTLFTSTSLQPSFPDKCLENSTYSTRVDYYCSPLHGWTKKEQNGGRLKNTLFKGKAPLTGEFATTHADLAKSKVGASDGDDLPRETLSIVSELEACKSQHQTTHKPFISGTPRIVEWKPSKPFIKKIIAGKEPVVLQNTVVQTWPALDKWNFSYIAEHMGTEILPSVKCTNSFVTFDADHRTPLKLNISLPFVKTNMTTKAFFDCIQAREEEEGGCSDGFKGHYYFGAVPEAMKEDVLPDTFLYNTEKDYKAKRQFMWVSSAGMITHTHFDQDYNFFVQLVGKKRFTLWSSSQHELMYMYPRVHPMWHKSRVNYQAVDSFKFPAFSQAKAVQIELGPGDMLHVPPYVWHYVETLTPSVSLSTWSHDYNLYDHMNSIYRHDHKFDLLEDPRGQMFVLRLYLDMMVHSLYGFNQTKHFFARLLANRFSGLEHLFPPSEDDPEICAANEPGKIPTCIHVHGYAKLDMQVIGSHFEALEPPVRDILFQDYVEEITAQVVGIKKMLAFFRYCFLGQEYYITDIEDEEHLLWEHKEITEEEST